MSRLLILDANVIITAFKDGLWTSLASRYRLIIPNIIVIESKYYTDSKGEKVNIDLGTEVDAKRIEVVETSPDELSVLYERFTDDFINATDIGELHALAYLYARKEQGLRFCTGDTPAIKAAAIMELTGTMVSLEKVLRECGLETICKGLKPHFKDEALQRKLGEGFQQRSLYERSKFRQT